MPANFIRNPNIYKVMKRIFALLTIASFFAFAACNNADNGEGEGEATEQSAEETHAEEMEAAEEAVETEMEATEEAATEEATEEAATEETAE